MISDVKVKLEDDVVQEQKPKPEGVPQWAPNGDLVLLSSEMNTFGVHQYHLMAHSKKFFAILSHLHNFAGVNNEKRAAPCLKVPFTNKEILIILPYLYNMGLPRIVSLRDEGIWGAIRFAVDYEITLAIEAFTRACHRYSSATATLEQKVLAFFVTAALHQHTLLNTTYKRILHHNAHDKVLAVTLTRLMQGGILPKSHATLEKVDFLMRNYMRRHANRAQLQKRLRDRLHLAQHVYHHHPSLPAATIGKVARCPCQQAVTIDTYWKHACQAKQHDLRTIAKMYKGTGMCDVVAKQMLFALWAEGEKVEPVSLIR